MVIVTNKDNLPDLVLEINDKEMFERVLKALRKSRSFKRVWVNPEVATNWIFVKK